MKINNQMGESAMSSKTFFRLMSGCVALTCIALFSATAAASTSPIPGKWEIQTMGADRDVELKRKGGQAILYRVLYPEFEGEKYKLEHLYRVNIEGDTLTGKLLVREEELPDYEELRAVTGSILSPKKLKLDDTVFVLKQAAKQITPKPQTKVKPKTKQSATPKAPASSQKKKEPESQDPGVNLFNNILGSPAGSDLFNISAKILLKDEGSEHIKTGDKHMRKKQFAKAVRAYESAIEQGVPTASVAQKIGTAYYRVKNYSKAKKFLKRALKIDPRNKKIRKLYRISKKRVK